MAAAPCNWMRLPGKLRLLTWMVKLIYFVRLERIVIFTYLV